MIRRRVQAPPSAAPVVPEGIVRCVVPDAPVVSVVVLAWKQTDLLLACLYALANHQSQHAFEVVLVLNGASDDVRRVVGDRVRGVKVVDSSVNLGFAGGCNRGVSHSVGEFVVLLNDDAVVQPRWLDRLVATASVDDRRAIVASRVVWPNGVTQEVGGSVLSDASLAVHHRGETATESAFLAPRRVDYSSGCSLLVRRKVWDSLGGMDTQYFPAYFEDVDLCLSAWTSGAEVWVDPSSVVVHHESSSTNAAVRNRFLDRNAVLFARKWSEFLATCAPNEPEAIRAALEHSRRVSRRVLVVDSLVPVQDGAAGHGRMFSEVCALVEPDTHVLFVATENTQPWAAAELASRGVEVSRSSVAELVTGAQPAFDVVVVSRPTNGAAVVDLVASMSKVPRVVYDAEALFSQRLLAEAANASDERVASRLNAEAADVQAVEQRILLAADHVVCVSSDEERIIRDIRQGRPTTLAPIDIGGAHITSQQFPERSGVVFIAGWLAGSDSPNGDAVRWMAHDIVPLLAPLDATAKVFVTGGNPPAELMRLESGQLQFTGHVDDLGELLSHVRVAIAPLRYGAGVKVKVLEALQRGVPVVATKFGAQGIDPRWRAGIVVADTAERIADAVAHLHSDREAWDTLRDNLLRADTDVRRRPAARLRDVVEREASRAIASRDPDAAPYAVRLSDEGVPHGGAYRDLTTARVR